MTILVTGAAGFVGRAVIDTLLMRCDEEIIAVDQNVETAPRDGVTYKNVNLASDDAIADLFNQPIDKVIHLAAVPGGLSEADPQLSALVNLNAPLALMKAATARIRKPRFIFSSSIAVFGDPLPKTGLDDDVPVSPNLIYGMHKAMVEIAVATKSRRGELDGINLRLPGIVARPAGAMGLKSAFLSDVFYALKASKPYVMPVSAKATTWILSAQQCADNICRSLDMDLSGLTTDRVINSPALHVSIEQLVKAIASELDVSVDLVSYAPDAMLEASFGAYPPLFTPLAEGLGLQADESLPVLVRQVFSQLEEAK